jgi:hypothetical protein
MTLWFVIHVPSGTQRQIYAHSSALAIEFTGWPALDCLAQEAR